MRIYIVSLKQHWIAITVTSTDEIILKKISSLLHFSMRSKNAIVGYNSLLVSNSKQIGLILINEETSENTIKKIVKRFPESTVKILPQDKSPGKLMGKNSIKVLGIKKSQFDNEIVKHLKSLEI